MVDEVCCKYPALLNHILDFYKKTGGTTLSHSTCNLLIFSQDL